MDALIPQPSPWVETFVDEYCADVAASMTSVLSSDLQRHEDRLVEVNRRAGSVLVFGNGGLSAVAKTVGATFAHALDHVADARYVGSWDVDRVCHQAVQRGMRGSYTAVLEQERVGPDDLVLLLSVSGRSRNLVDVARHCRARRIPVIACTGRSGGDLGELLGDDVVRTVDDDQQVAEDTIHGVMPALLARVACRLHGGRPAVVEDRDDLLSVVVQHAGAIEAAADALAGAVAERSRIAVLAPEGGLLGPAAEHLAHNLMWDLTHDDDDIAPDIRCGVSFADLTGMGNDSDDPGTPARRLLASGRRGDATVLLADDAEASATAGARDVAEATGVASHGWYGSATTGRRNEVAVTTGRRGWPAAISAQLTGHLLLRVTRAKLLGRRETGTDGAAAAVHARTAVAPLAVRYGPPQAGS